MGYRKAQRAHHVSVISPGTELHVALLLIKGEELDVDLAGGLIDGGRVPGHFARVVQDGFSHYGHLVVSVRAVEKSEIKIYMICILLHVCLTYLLYSTISGSQMSYDGTCRCFTPP